MKTWLIYRKKSLTPMNLIKFISDSAELIRRPNSGHAYSHNVEYIVNFSNKRVKCVGYQTERSRERKDAFWHKLHKEEDIIKLVHNYRKESLFNNHIARIHPDMQKLMIKFSDLYMYIWNRQDERVFLKDCNQEAWALFCEIRKTINPTNPYFKSLEQEWHDYTRVWRWTKRNTSFSSFPFLRPGIDVHKGYGFDLNGDEGKVWYAVVQFIY